MATTAATGGPVPDDVVDQILAQAPNADVAEAMLLGSSYEGGWGPSFAVGDNGTSFGPFQMHIGGILSSLGFTPAQAEDPATAVRGILPYYESTVSQQPQSLWQTDPSLAAEQSAAQAERPAVSYLQNYGPAVLASHWSEVQGALQGNVSVAPYSGTASGSTSTSGSTGSAVYQPASRTLGKVLQYVDGFFNPKTTVVPAWTDIFGGSTVNSAASAVITAVDRGIGVFFGVGLVYIGIRLVTQGNQGPASILPSLASTAADVYTGRERAAVQKAAVAQRAFTSVTSAGSRDYATTTRAQTEAQKNTIRVQQAAQRAAENQEKAKQKEQDRQQRAERDRRNAAQQAERNRQAQERINLAWEAEARRQEETLRVSRREREREQRG